LEPYGIPGYQAVALSLFAFVVHIALATVGGLLELWGMFLPRRRSEVEAGSAETDDGSTLP
jgi:hypothetical protein